MRIYGSPETRKRRKKPDYEWLAFLSDEEKEAERVNKWKEVSLADIGLSVRIANTLEENDIFTVGDLAEKTEEDLKCLANLGAVTIEKCRKLLEDLKIPNKLKGKK